MRLVRRIWIIVAIVLLSVFHVFFPSGVQAEADKAAISVNGIKISEAEVQREINIQMARGIFHRGASQNQKKKEQFRKQVIDRLIEIELLHQEARRLGLSIDEAEVREAFDREVNAYKSKKDFYKFLERQGIDEKGYRRQIERDLLVKKVLKQEVEDKVEVSEGDIKRYYDENKHRFVIPEEIRLREIFIKVEANATSEERMKKRQLAESIRRRAVAGEDFAELARRFSEDENRANGGDTGYIHVNMLAADMAGEIKSLKINEISSVVEHLYGFYIFKMEDRKPEKQRSFEEVRERLLLEVPLEMTKKIRDAFINGLKAKAKIEIY